MPGGFSRGGSKSNAEAGKEERTEDGVDHIGALRLGVERPKEEDKFDEVVEGEGGEEGQVGVEEVEEGVEEEVLDEEFHDDGLGDFDCFEGAEDGVGEAGEEPVGRWGVGKGVGGGEVVSSMTLLTYERLSGCWQRAATPLKGKCRR